MSTSKPQLSDPITLRLPVEVLTDLEAIAETCERTRSWVMVRAMKLYLASEGADILAVRQGRRELEAGAVEDLDDLIRELEEIVDSKAA